MEGKVEHPKCLTDCAFTVVRDFVVANDLKWLLPFVNRCTEIHFEDTDYEFHDTPCTNIFHAIYHLAGLQNNEHKEEFWSITKILVAAICHADV